MNKELLCKVEKIVEHQNKRGHAADRSVPNDHFQSPREYQESRALGEHNIAYDFADAYACQYGKKITDIKSNPDDPPDILALLDGKEIGIEITELVKEEILRDNAMAWTSLQKQAGGKDKELTLEEKREQQQINYKATYEKSQWRKEEFLKRLQHRIKGKDESESLAKCIANMNVMLVIYTDESFLQNDHLKNWLSNAVFPVQNVSDIFLLGPYEAKSNAQLRPFGPSVPELPAHLIHKLNIE